MRATPGPASRRRRGAHATRLRVLLPAVVAVSGALVLGGPSARSSFPGENGVVVFQSTRSLAASGEVYAVGADGAGRVDLSRDPAPEGDASWSPDGTRIAFTREGTVVTMRADGSGQLVVGRGATPRWSPDGARLVFVRDGDLWTAGADGSSPVRLTTSGSLEGAQWSPDGTRIAFARGAFGGFELFSIPASGGPELELARSQVYGDAPAFAWLDPQALVYANVNVLYRVSADGTSVRVLARVGQGIGSLAPSHDRSSVVVSALGESVGGLYVVPSGGGEPHRITDAGIGYDRLAAWSPDDTHIAYTRYPDAHIHVISAGGSGERLLPAEHPGTSFDTLEWSPDGSRLLFATALVDDDELYAVDSGGAPPRALTSNWVEDIDPAWSPDGRELAFASNRTGNYDVYVRGADGRVRRITSSPAQEGDPAWSPDGSQLVFLRSEGAESLHLFVRDLARGRERQITSGSGAEYNPAWSPDGKRILFAQADDPPRLATVQPDGTARRALGEVTGDEPSWSPDGRTIAFDHVFYLDGLRLAPTSPPPMSSLAVVDANGENLRDLPADGESAEWSPDGRFLVVDGIRVVSPGGTLVQDLAGGPGGHASWQPRCTRLGTPRRDVLRGGGGDDLVCGLGGDDTIVGGRGRDRLFGEAGDDRIDARDGSGDDVVGCGPGRDVVLADRGDLVGRDCERVLR